MRKGCGSKLCHFGILSASDAEKCANHCSLCIDCRSVLGINPEGIKTVSGIFQEYAERLRNECGFIKLDSASCPRPSGRQVLREQHKARQQLYRRDSIK